MSRMIRFACPSCGKHLKARPESTGKKGWCRRCGQLVQVLDALRDGRNDTTARGAGHADLPGPAVSESAARETESTLLICAIMSVGGLILAVALAWSLETKRRTAAEQWANKTVADRIEAAREDMAHRKWDKAVDVLDQAFGMEGATHFKDGQELLLQARHAQADAVFEAAEAAIRHKDTARSLRLLRDYLANPYGTENDKAAHLHEEIALAASDDQAVALLGRLPGEALAVLQAGGTLPEIDHIHHPAVREMYRERLQGHLPREQARRAAAARLAEEKQVAEARRMRQEQERRVARVGATPVVRELAEFVALTEKRLGERETSTDDQQLLAHALEELDVTDREEQTKLLQDGKTQDEARDSIEEKISRKRASVKERFRSYKDFDQIDWAIFDRAVDQELDRLLEEVKSR